MSGTSIAFRMPMRTLLLGVALLAACGEKGVSSAAPDPAADRKPPPEPAATPATPAAIVLPSANAGEAVAADVFVLVSSDQLYVGEMPLDGLRSEAGSLRLQAPFPGRAVERDGVQAAVDELLAAKRSPKGGGGTGDLVGGEIGEGGLGFGMGGGGGGEIGVAGGGVPKRKANAGKRSSAPDRGAVDVDFSKKKAQAMAAALTTIESPVLVVADASTPAERVGEVLRLVTASQALIVCPSIAAARDSEIVAVPVARCTAARSPSRTAQLEVTPSLLVSAIGSKLTELGDQSAQQSALVDLVPGSGASLEHLLAIFDAARSDETFRRVRLNLGTSP